MTENEENKMTVTVVEVNIDEDYIRHPAIPRSDPTGTVIFLKDDKVVAYGHIGSYRFGSGEVTVYLNRGDEKSLAFFKDDYAVKDLGYHAGFRFARHDGGPTVLYSDEPAGRLDGISIVSQYEFEWGYASKKRYGHIVGFGARVGEVKQGDK